MDVGGIYWNLCADLLLLSALDSLQQEAMVHNPHHHCPHRRVYFSLLGGASVITFDGLTWYSYI